jgi:hypothetical protein
MQVPELQKAPLIMRTTMSHPATPSFISNATSILHFPLFELRELPSVDDPSQKPVILQ